MSTRLDHQERTMRAIFAHPVARNIAWPDARELLSRVGSVSAAPNGKLKVRVGPATFAFEPSGAKLSVAEVTKIRQIFEGAGLAPAAARANPARRANLPEHAGRDIVVITFRSARIFHGDASGTPPEVVEVQEPPAKLHRKAENLTGDYEPPGREYFARVADAIRAAGEVLLIGHGKGHSSAVSGFAEYLDGSERTIAARVLGTLDLDPGKYSDAQILARSRDFP